MTEYDVDHLRALVADGLIRWDQDGNVYLDPSNLPTLPSEKVQACEQARLALEQYRSNMVGSARWQSELRQYADGQGSRADQGGGTYWSLLRDVVEACADLDMTVEQIADYCDVPTKHVNRFERAPRYKEALLLVRDHGMSMRAAAERCGVNASWLSIKGASMGIRGHDSSRIPSDVIDLFDNLIAQDGTRQKWAWEQTQDLEGGHLFTYENAKVRVHRRRKAGKVAPVGYKNWSDYKDGITAKRASA